MKKDLILVAALIALSSCFNSGEARAQSEELQRFEVGVHFSSLTLDTSSTTEAGLGVRFTYNATKNIAFEAEGNLFPHDARARAQLDGGRGAEGLFGVKIGKRYEKFGIFAKARPGLISFTRGKFNIVPNNDGSSFPFDLRTERLTHFAFDVGGVLEFYPTRRIVARFDAGDTIIRYGDTTLDTFSGPAGGPFTPLQFTVPGNITHNFQFTAGVGFRF
jgi:hypothetical protein